MCMDVYVYFPYILLSCFFSNIVLRGKHNKPMLLGKIYDCNYSIYYLLFYINEINYSLKVPE